MKSIVRVFIIVLAMLPIAGFAQEKKSPSWPELKKFHSYMSSTFHPAEEGDLKPVRVKADSMLIAAKVWQASKIPSNYKPVETKETLEKLVAQLATLKEAVDGNADDEKLKTMITDAHDIFHKIVGECKKTD